MNTELRAARSRLPFNPFSKPLDYSNISTSRRLWYISPIGFAGAVVAAIDYTLPPQGKGIPYVYAGQRKTRCLSQLTRMTSVVGCRDLSSPLSLSNAIRRLALFPLALRSVCNRRSERQHPQQHHHQHHRPQFRQQRQWKQNATQRVEMSVACP